MSSSFDAFRDLIDIFWEQSQNQKLTDLNREVNQLRERARYTAATNPMQSQLDELRADNGVLRLYVATLLKLLQDKRLIERDELLRVLEQVDGQDGRQDQSHTGELL